jgi:Ca-activated chloride channel family protein
LFLLSDGQANAGETKKSTLAQEASKARELGITTTTIGIGDDFQEDLLEAIASESGGRFWYIKESRIEDILEEEFKGSLSVVVDRPRLAVKLPAGVTLSRELNSMSKISGRYRLRPIQGDDILNFAVRLAFDPAEVKGGIAALEATLLDGDRELLSTQAHVRLAAANEYVTSPVNALVKSVVQQYEVSSSNERLLKQMADDNGLELMKKMLLADASGMRVARDALEGQRPAYPGAAGAAVSPTASRSPRREPARAMPRSRADRRSSAGFDVDELRVEDEIRYLELEIAGKEGDLLITELLAEFATEPAVTAFGQRMRKVLMHDMQRLKLRANDYATHDRTAHIDLLAEAIDLVDALLAKFPTKRGTLTAQQSKLRERLARYQ